jgi:hypothetical protein
VLTGPLWSPAWNAPRARSRSALTAASSSRSRLIRCVTSPRACAPRATAARPLYTLVVVARPDGMLGLRRASASVVDADLARLAREVGRTESSTRGEKHRAPMSSSSSTRLGQDRRAPTGVSTPPRMLRSTRSWPYAAILDRRAGPEDACANGRDPPSCLVPARAAGGKESTRVAAVVCFRRGGRGATARASRAHLSTVPARQGRAGRPRPKRAAVVHRRGQDHPCPNR